MASSSTIQPPSVPSSTTPLTSTTTTHQNQNQNQNPIVSNLPPQSKHTNNSNFNPKKRPLDHIYLQSSPYFKLRAILKELRPLFLEVIRAPDFQNCAAAGTIQEKMKQMVEICKVPIVKCNSGTGGSSQKFAEQRTQDKRFSSGTNFVKPTTGSLEIPGTYIVGGSAFGWNFITFHGTKPMYYGRTKEAFRAGK